MTCRCGQTPCQTLPLNGGAPWFYAATKGMGDGERMVFRARHADPQETRSLTALVGMAFAVLAAQQPHLFERSQP